MASAANPVPTPNSTSGIQSFVPGQKDVSGKSNMKSTSNVKMNERGRKESPVDNTRRSQARAWVSGSNPITQRGITPTQANGSTMQTKAGGPTKFTMQKESGLSEKHGHDRLRYILAAAVGLSVIFTTRNGEKFEGFFAGSTSANSTTKITLKMTRKMQNNSNHINGVAAREAALVGTSPEHAMTFDLKDMMNLSIPDFSLPEPSRQVNGGTTSFQTDTDISGNAMRGERALQRWEPEGPLDAKMSLDSTSLGMWDQFETHNKMFGNKSTYDESLYTTEIDRRAPGYKQREAEASRIAREIEGSTSTNAHIREERGQTIEQDFEDEEAKYSGVRRDEQGVVPTPAGGPAKYTPPARRAPTAAPTVAGAPFDSAIFSAQLSNPDGSRSIPPTKSTEKLQQNVPASLTDHKQAFKTSQSQAEASGKPQAIDTSLSPQPKPMADNPSESVEVKVLDHFRQFANSERAKIAKISERRRAQATQDRTAKFNELKSFSKTFKLKTLIPTDLVGILAKDPAKQEAIIERAQKDHEAAKTVPAVTSPSVPGPTTSVPSTTTTSAASSAKPPSVPKFDASQIPPPIPDRTLARGRGGYIHGAVRGDRGPQQTAQFSGRGAPVFNQRPTATYERKIQVPIPTPLSTEGRTPPIGSMADQGVASPQRSNMHTSSSAMSTRMNARAVEFRPTAPSFNPTTSSNAPSSPASLSKAGSASRAASPSSFFGVSKLKAMSERPSVSANFNPIKRMRQESKARKSGDKSDEPVKDYAFNGGIPNAYHTGPVWVVKDENKDKSYLSAFERPGMSSSPSQVRTSSVHQMSYQGQMPTASNGGIPQLATPQHGPHGSQHYGHQFDEHRMHMPTGTPQVFASPGMASRQMSNFSSPMSHQAQLAYGQPQYYGAPGGQLPMQLRQYPNTPGMIHAQPGQIAAPMMVQQTSSGPYMTVPQGYSQMQMYSPSPNHVYPQQNGYPSPGRMAPMMMQQGSQHSHHGGQPVMYTMPGQTGPLMYGQQGQIGMMRGGYGGPQAVYASSPHQPHHLQHRVMSSGYGQKGMPQAMQQNQGPPANAPPPPAAYVQVEMGSEDSK